jgi:hypothetical protein
VGPGATAPLIHPKTPFTTNFRIISTWSRILLEKLIVALLVKKFPICYGTQSFMTLFIIVHQKYSVHSFIPYFLKNLFGWYPTIQGLTE